MIVTHDTYHATLVWDWVGTPACPPPRSLSNVFTAEERSTCTYIRVASLDLVLTQLAVAGYSVGFLEVPDVVPTTILGYHYERLQLLQAQNVLVKYSISNQIH